MGSESPDICDLLQRAREGDQQASGQLLEHYRTYLSLLAQQQLRGRIACRVGPSDIVQQTMLEAYRNFHQFLGSASPELLGWLRSILNHNIAGAIRQHTQRHMRDIRRECSLDADPGSARDGQTELDAQQSSPSERAMRGEELARLSRALATLPDDQRQAVRLRHLEGWSLLEIARHLNRSPAAAAGLIKRGMQSLREQLRDAQ
jgi:RNA polymerase sigma-70 factor (ECF subfamily)